MPNKTIILPQVLLIVLTLVSACSSSGAQPTVVSPQQTSIDPATATIAPTSSPQPSPTIDVNSLQIDDLLFLLVEGNIEYPANFSDERKAELSIAIAEYLNENATADEAYVEMSFDNVGEVKIGWNPDTKRWVSNHNTPESEIDFAGESLPPLFIPGYTNNEGREVFIDPETGEETVVPAINLPGLGEVSLTELYQMDQQELMNYAVDFMLNAEGMHEVVLNFVNSLRSDHIFLPTVIYRDGQENERIYQNIFRLTKPNSQIPEANITFIDHPTNSVVLPIIDQNSNQVLFWINLQQGRQFTHTIDGRFASDGSTFLSGPRSEPAVGKEDQLFGADSNHTFGILIPGQSTEITYSGIGSEPLLENGETIGSEQQILSLIQHSGDLESFIRALENLNMRILVLYPQAVIHQSSQ